MTRLDLIPRDYLDPELRDTLAAFARSCPDFNPAVFQVMGHNPELSNAFYRFYIPTRLNGLLDNRLKELVRLKIASRLGASSAYFLLLRVTPDAPTF